MEKGLVLSHESVLTKSFASRFARGKRGDLNWAAERAYALALIEKSPALARCTPESFAMSMLDVAWTGLSLSPVTQHATLVPYYNKDSKTTLMTLKPMYRGLEHLVFKAGTVKSIQTALVYTGDKFQVETRDNRRIITHKENHGDNAKVTHAYCILHYTNGGEYVEVMNATELAAVEKQAKSVAGGGYAWDGPFNGEMKRKSVLRRALKHTPLDDGGAIEHAIKVNDRLDPVEFSREPVEREPVEELIGKQQILELHAFLTDNGLPGTAADLWLEKLAEALGFSAVEEIPVKHFEDAKARLAARYKAWRASQS